MPRRYRDDDYDSDDDIDRDPDEEYRRRVDRYGPELTEEEEDQEEKASEESAQAARRIALWPGILLIVSGALTLLGGAAFVVSLVMATGTGPGAGPGAAVTLVSMGICAGIPLLFVLGFSILQLIGGVCLVRRKGRGMVIAGSILGALSVVVIIVIGLMSNFPNNVWLALGPSLVSIPAAVWMFVAMGDHDLQEAFDRAKRYG